MRTREQQRAEKVYQQITHIQDSKMDWAEDYGRICLSFPAFVFQCGLCQAVAFGQSKSDARDQGRKKAFHQFLTDLASAVGYGSLDAFADEVRRADIGKYQHLTREVMALSNWYKRYAEAILKVEPGSED
jgi:CRISPR-associated protein Cmr5